MGRLEMEIQRQGWDRKRGRKDRRVDRTVRKGRMQNTVVRSEEERGVKELDPKIRIKKGR